MKTIATLLIAVCIGGFVSILSACDGSMFLHNQIAGSGKLVTAQRAHKDFKGIEAGGAVEVIVTAQQDYKVEVEADDNIISHVITKVNDGTLEISMDPEFSYSNSTIKIYVSLPQLASLDISGASTAKVTNVNSDDLSISVSGASNVTIEGSSKTLDGSVSGASSIMAEKLSAEQVTIEASGASKSHVHATSSLSADASGASTIYYSGQPKNIEEETSGASSIKRR
jgi:hypothetical protein